MDAALEQNMTTWDSKAGDRVDPVAQALRRLYLRVELCPCGGGNCRQCQLDKESIESAWRASEGATDR